MRQRQDSIYQVLGDRSFVVFNDGPLSMEPIEADDLEPIEVKLGRWCASATWSSGCNWFFVFLPDGIMLLNALTNRGYFCRKRSAKFIEMFLDGWRTGDED